MYLALYYNPMERPLGNILQTRGIFFKIWMSVKIVYSGYSIPTELLIQLICLIITSYFNLLLSFLFCLFLLTSVSWFVISYHGYNKVAATAAAKSLQLCPTLWDPIDGSPPGSPKNSGVGWHFLLQCMKVKSESEVTQLCLTLSDLMDCSLPGSSIHGIFQARVLEWGGIAFSVIK